MLESAFSYFMYPMYMILMYMNYYREKIYICNLNVVKGLCKPYQTFCVFNNRNVKSRNVCFWRVSVKEMPHWQGTVYKAACGRPQNFDIPGQGHWMSYHAVPLSLTIMI